MTSLVTELQREALDKSVPAGDLLRKALVVARKLKIEDIQPWLKSELNGYSNSEEGPKYRWVTGEIKAFNPLSIPSYFHKMANILLYSLCSASMAANSSSNGRNRSGGQLGICS